MQRFQVSIRISVFMRRFYAWYALACTVCLQTRLSSKTLARWFSDLGLRLRM